MKHSLEEALPPSKRERIDGESYKSAESSGNPTPPQDSMQNLWNLLKHAARKHPTHGLLFRNSGLSSPPTKLLYSELLQRAADRGKALFEAGIVKKGEPIVVFFEHAEDLLIWTWSVIASGAVPAILPPLSNDPKTLEGQLENLSVLFGSPSLLTKRKLFSKFASAPFLHLQAVESIHIRHGDISLAGASNVSSDDLAVLLFTSGSTGRSKAVEIRHGQVITSARAKQMRHNLSPDMNFMAWISLDHSANFCELHINALFNGANQIHVRTMCVVEDPGLFWHLLSEDRIGYSFGPNFFLSKSVKAVKLREKPSALDLSALRVLMVGGEANRTSTFEVADKLVMAHGAPAHSIKAAYGLSETCSACFYNMEAPQYDIARQNVFSSVGRHVSPGMELRIVNETLDPVGRGQQGAIQLRGEIVFRRYYNNKAATEECMTIDGWFDTGDLGSQDDEGNLEIVGRTKEILILNGNNYSSFELEYAIDSHVATGMTKSYTASFALWDKATESEGVVILFNPSDDISEDHDKVAETIRAVRQACVKFCAKAPVDVVPLPRHEMPKSTIGKLSRQQLKKHYAAGAFDKYRFELSEGENELNCESNPLGTEVRAKIAEALSKEIGVRASDIKASTSMLHTGVDSLTYLRIKRKIEESLKLVCEMPMALLLNASTVGELEKILAKELESPHYFDDRSGDQDYDPIVTLRGSGFQNPIFLVHPGGGEFLIWLSMLRFMPDRPMYAFRIRGFHHNETTFASFEEMLDCYEAGVLRVQPEGPYAFMGLCFGGAVGFELARRLEARGKNVAFCGGIDNPPQLGLMNPDGGFKMFMLQLMAFHGFFSIEEAHRLEDRYAEFPDQDIGFVNQIYKDFQGPNLDAAGLTHNKISTWRRIFLNTIDMVIKYRAEGKVKRYDVFHVPPMDRRRFSDEEWMGLIKQWDNYADDVKYHKVTGNHFTVLNSPQVEVFQKALNQALVAAGL